MSVTAHNAEETHWAAASTLHVTSTPPGIALTSHSPHPPRLAPAQTRAVRLDLDKAGIDPGELIVGSPINVKVELTYDVAAAPRRAVFHLSMAVLAWPPEVYDATYIDDNGSAQAVAPLPPSSDCYAAGGCSALLSTYRAGVDALSDDWCICQITGRMGLLPTGSLQYGEHMASGLRSSGNSRRTSRRARARTRNSHHP